MKQSKNWILILWLMSAQVFGQVGQININRVQQMPDFPSPYIMRQWKDVAVGYDEFVFSTSATGQYLPVIHIKPNGINYPALHPILLDTYVGSSTAGNQAEAINIMPALVGATLMGIDKANQNGVNWVIKAKDFFNQANGQNVYLNGYSTTSGDDWWYDLMPNVYFYQLYSQYPTQLDFNQQFTTIADRWLEAVHTMGGSTTPWTIPQMNYRAWDLMTMTGNTVGVKEPESAGTMAWLLYQAYSQTSDKKYLYGAQMAMEFLSGQNPNPSYELQLPYGTFMAAKMNAELGTNYDIAKMINWSFDKGLLRNWGTIVGTWDGQDVSGLIGEANDAGNDYAFVMNGFQQAAALVPLVKYDKRFTRAVAKWVLNLANASRFFYSAYRPAISQDNFTWSSVNDPQSVIAYESLKENLNGKKLFATGDAMTGGWAQTNLSIYSSSSVGYMAAILEPTDVDGILLLDLNKTDFFAKNSFPTYAVYNPYAIDKQITLTLPVGAHDVYDAISETVLATGVSGNVSIIIKADQAVQLVYWPAGSLPQSIGGKLYVANQVVDYHYGYDFSAALRIKSLSVADTLVEFNQHVPVYAKVEQAAADVSYTWLLNGVIIDSFTENLYTWTVPSVTGRTVLRLNVKSNGKTVTDSIVFKVVSHIPSAPVVQAISTDKRWYATGSEAVLHCEASDDNAPTELTYHWTLSAGTIVNQDVATLIWQLPAVEGIYEATCDVTDLDNLTTTMKKLVLVKQPTADVTPAFAYYPFDGDVNDYSGHNRHAKMVGVDPAPDARGEPGKAYLFNASSDIIFVDNSSELNFQNQITLSFWVKLNSLTEESFILSHGSWEQRWKVSVTPTGRLRWTVKTSTGTKDLDGTFPLLLNQFYHVALVYSGYSMELYADGELDNFLEHTGLMNTTVKSLTFGRKDESVTNYSLHGILDEVRIYDTVVSPDEISTWKTMWNVTTGIGEEASLSFVIYPNPVQRDFVILNTGAEVITDVRIMDVNGHSVDLRWRMLNKQINVANENQPAGILIVRINTTRAVYYRKVVFQ